MPIARFLSDLEYVIGVWSQESILYVHLITGYLNGRKSLGYFGVAFRFTFVISHKDYSSFKACIIFFQSLPFKIHLNNDRAFQTTPFDP
jgi:hypothetical protein